MKEITNKDLIQKAKSVIIPRKISHDFYVGIVGCAILSEKGNIYLGASIDTCSGMGFCAEHSAIAAMVTNNEQKIKKIVAVFENGNIAAPCGRCREFMYQIDKENIHAEIIMEENKTIKLKELLPYRWDE